MYSKPSTLLYIICHLKDFLKLVIITPMIQFQRLQEVIHLFAEKLCGARIGIIINRLPALVVTLQSNHGLTLQIYILTPYN